MRANLELADTIEDFETPELPDTARRVLVVFNPIAGRRRRSRYEAVIAALEKLGCRITIRETRCRGDAQAFAGAVLRDEFDVIAVAGGDGTINEVANGLGPAAPPLAVIPLGTANVLAAEIGLPIDPDAVARTIAGAPPTLVHVGTVNGRRFLMMAGAGFDAHVVANVDPVMKRRFGKLAYVWQTFVQFKRYRFPELRVTIDGTAYSAYSAVIANGHYYGGRFVCAPDARLTLPHLDVCLFTRPGRLNAARYATALSLGFLPKLPDIKIVQGRRISVSGPLGDPIQADGDLMSRLPGEITLASDGIWVLCPPGSKK